MVILSAHLDKVRNDGNLTFEGGVHQGLLDNFLGVLVSYLTVYDNPALRLLCKSGSLKVVHSQGEEFGVDDLPSVSKNDVVIVIDLGRSDGKDFSIENFYNWDELSIKQFCDFLDSEDLQYEYKPVAVDDDESCVWSKRGCRVFSLCIPVVGKYHANINLDMESLVKVREALKRIITYFVT